MEGGGGESSLPNLGETAAVSALKDGLSYGVGGPGILKN